MRTLLIGLVCVSLSARTYTTSFPAAENPISEGGNWINGLAVGLDWNNCYTTVGFAGGVDPVGVAYSDPTCILAGYWGPDQTITTTAHIGTTDSSMWQEIEHRLRSAISAHSNTGYEINFGVSHAYVQIVKWNGALGSYAYLGSSCSYPTVCGQVTGISPSNGDVLKSTIVGTTISAYIQFGGTGSFVLVAQTTDSTYATGAPGMGFDYGCNGTYAIFGFSNFTATDGLNSVYQGTVKGTFK